LLEQYKISEDDLYQDDPDDFYFHPVTIAQCILGCFNLIIEGKREPYEKIFWANVNWLVNNGVNQNDSLVYPFPYGLPSFNPEPGWVSGMYQGQILSCFIRASLLKDRKLYLSYAEKIWKSFSLKLGERYGFRYEAKDELWFEEAPKFPVSHILNGAIFALWGLYDYKEFNNDPRLERDYNQGLETIKKNLYRYDLGFWSAYDIKRTIASYAYHNEVHTLQLRVLYDQTGDEVFLKYATKWEKYGEKRVNNIMKKLYTIIQLINKRKKR